MNKYLKQQKTTRLEYACCRAGREYMLKAYGADVYDNVSPKQVWKGLLRDVRAILRGNSQFVGPKSLHAAWVRRKRACGLGIKDNSSICSWDELDPADQDKWIGFVIEIQATARDFEPGARGSVQESSVSDDFFHGEELIDTLTFKMAPDGQPYIEIDFDNGEYCRYRVANSLFFEVES